MTNDNNQIIRNNIPTFKVWIYDGLRQCNEKIEKWDDDPQKNSQDLYIICRNIKGACKIFKYQLLSDLSSLFCIYISENPKVDINVSIMNELIDTMYIVMDNDITDDGGEIGKDIMNQLMVKIL